MNFQFFITIESDIIAEPKYHIPDGHFEVWNTFVAQKMAVAEGFL